MREEETWALNVKRGILSVLQGNLKIPSAGRSIEEVKYLCVKHVHSHLRHFQFTKNVDPSYPPLLALTIDLSIFFPV